MTRTYEEFLESKRLRALSSGRDIDRSLINPKTFDYQRDIITFAIRKGRGAIFTDAGTGKTLMGLEFCRLMDETTLIIAVYPAVARQIVREARELWGLEVRYIRSSSEVAPDHKLYITNIDAVQTKKKGVTTEHFDPSLFGTVWLDESSILKALTGKQKTMLCNFAKVIPYRLCTTATPAPNDITEIANHAEFLGIMTRNEMMATFFTYDSKGTSKAESWRLKKHAHQHFYRWLASWSISMKKPSDLGYSDEGFELPPLNYHLIEVGSEYTPPGMLPGFAPQVVSATELSEVKRQTMGDRLDAIADLVNASPDQWLIWGSLNDETHSLEKRLDSSVDVHGSLDPELKGELIEKWIDRGYDNLISKPTIAGMGMNFQHCSKMIFFGLSYSWEQFYQARKRIHRYGQTKPVDVYIVISKQERGVYNAVLRKEKEAEKMSEELIKASRVYSMEELRQSYTEEWRYMTEQTQTDSWEMWLGDSCVRMAEIPDESVDLSVYSPPFKDVIFAYSPTERDLGNSVTPETFYEQFGFIVEQNYRITKPGRLCCVHITDSRALKSQDGYIGRKDFSGEVIELYQRFGWVFWQRITVDKNPQAQAIRLKDHGLLFKTLEKDACDLSGGHADYILIFKKPGTNAVPVTPLENGEMSNEDWITWAHPIWLDISETNVLNVRESRDPDSEKHLCPLQLDLIERCIRLWSNPDEVVFDPFAGIGSVPYVAVKLGRRGFGMELNPTYYATAVKNMYRAEQAKSQRSLFDWARDQEKKELTQQDIQSIKERFRSEEERIGMQELADEYGVSVYEISKVIHSHEEA